MIGWLIFFTILLGLAIMPLGVLVDFDKRASVKIIVGVIHLTVFPVPDWMKRKSKPKPQKPAQQPKIDSEDKELKTPKSELSNFMPFIRLGIDFLNTFRKKLRIQRLNVKVIMAGDDPCDLAVNYGKAWAAAGNLIASLERVFVIKKRNVEPECDFTADKTVIKAKAELTITLGRLFALAALYGVRAIREYLSMKKKHEKAVQTL